MKGMHSTGSHLDWQNRSFTLTVPRCINASQYKYQTHSENSVSDNFTLSAQDLTLQKYAIQCQPRVLLLEVCLHQE